MFFTGGVVDCCKAVIHQVFPEGDHGPYAMATACDRPDIAGSITFSLDRTVWDENEWPEEGEAVLLGKLRLKRAGWRAKEGRFWTPSDERTITQQRARSDAMIINLNQDISFTLTERGRRILDDDLERMAKESDKDAELHPEFKERHKEAAAKLRALKSVPLTKMQLNAFMRLFGPELRAGEQSPVEGNVITILE